MRHVAWFCLLAWLLSVRAAPAAEPRVAIPPELVIQQFDVAKGGALLLVPVRVKDRHYLFVVDTGCTMSVFDVSMGLGPARGTYRVRTPHGPVTAATYETPDASIRGIPLSASPLSRPISRVAGMDLSSLREVTGLPIRGLLGMDSLGQYIVHIDFDRGALLLLKSIPTQNCPMVPLFWDFGAEPEVEVEVEVGGPRTRFRIDTGQGGTEIGAIETREMTELVAQGKLEEAESTPTLTLSGIKDVKVYQGKRLAIGDRVIDQPRFLEIAGKDQLGLGCLSRFTVTLDFPGRKLYLLRSPDPAKLL